MKREHVVLPIEVHRISVTPKGGRTPCVYRYATVEDRDLHLVVERQVLGLSAR